MQRLIGIPWGHLDPPTEAGCLSLMIYAQEVLFGKKLDLTGVDMGWELKGLRERSQDILKIVPLYCDKVENIQRGDIGTIQTMGYCHLVTFVEKHLILHTALNSKSRITQYRENNKTTIWRIKEVRIYQH